jgi:hypothetical protein
MAPPGNQTDSRQGESGPVNDTPDCLATTNRPSTTLRYLVSDVQWSMTELSQQRAESQMTEPAEPTTEKTQPVDQVYPNGVPDEPQFELLSEPDWFSIKRAAEVTSVHANTVRRRLRKGGVPGEFPGAKQDPYGVWKIPKGDLLAAGLTLNAPKEGQGEPVAPPDNAELTRLREEVARWRNRAEVAEALAGERDRALVIAENALRALGPGSGATTHTEPENRSAGPSWPDSAPEIELAEESRPPGFWARLFGAG